MEFITILIVLVVISFLWALWSLRRELSSPAEIKKAKNEFKREKILYKAR